MPCNVRKKLCFHLWTAQWRNYNFCPLANIRYWLTVLIHNSGHFGPPKPFWAPGPPVLPGLPMASYATGTASLSLFVQLAGTLMQQIFGSLGGVIFTVAQWSVGYEIDALYAEMFISLFHSTTTSHKGSKCRLATHSITSFETCKYSF